jgi:drug/metabolite transporter (DMT)-like permease
MVLASAAGYATLPALVKLAYEHGADAAGVLALRFGISAPIVVAWAALRRSGRSMRGAMSGLAFPAVLYFLQTLAFFESLARMSAVVAVLALFSYPLMVAAGDVVFFGETMSRGRAALIVAGSAGVALSVGFSGKTDFWGLVLALVSAVLFAAFFLMAKQRLSDSDLDGLTLTAVTYLVCGLGFPLVAAVGGAAAPSDGAGWIAVAVIVVLGTVFAAVLLYSGLRHLPAGIASMLSAAEPPLAVALAAVVLGEHVGATQVLGMALVVASLGALSYSVTRPATAGPGGELPAA